MSWANLIARAIAAGTPSGSTTSTPSAPLVTPPPAPSTAITLDDGRKLVQKNGQWMVQNPGWFFEEPNAGGGWAEATPGRYYRENTDPYDGTSRVYESEFDTAFNQANLSDLIAGDVWTGFGEGGNAYDLMGLAPAGIDQGWLNNTPTWATKYQENVRSNPYYTAQALLAEAAPEGGSLSPYFNMSKFTPEDWQEVFAGMDPAYAQQVIDELMKEQNVRIEDAKDKDLTDYADAFMNPLSIGLLFAGLPGTAGLTGAAAGTSLLGLAGGGLSGLSGGLFSPATGSKLVTAGANIGLGGANVEDALKGLVTGEGFGMLADAAAPYVNDLVKSGGNWLSGSETDEVLENLDMQDMEAAAKPVFKLAERGYSIAPQFAGEQDIFGNPIQSSTPAMTMVEDLESPTGMRAVPLETVNALGYEFSSPATTLSSTSGSTTEQPEQLDITGADLQKYAKLAQTVNELLGGDQPADAPVQDEGESREQFEQEIAAYMNLDAAQMAEMGLQPGSQAYMDYILQQADAIIAQITQGMDVNAEDLSTQLRDKTTEEMQQLQRALYVRGTLGQSMGEGSYVDPFTGGEQEVLGEGMFNPSVGAYQRGLAGSFQNIARGGGMSDFMSLLGRDADLFNMQGRADEAMELAKQSEGDIRKRRGMFSY